MEQQLIWLILCSVALVLISSHSFGNFDIGYFWQHAMHVQNSSPAAPKTWNLVKLSSQQTFAFDVSQVALISTAVTHHKQQSSSIVNNMPLGTTHICITVRNSTTYE